MTPGFYKAHGGHTLIVVSVARKYLRTVRIKSGELQLRRETEQALVAQRYQPCDTPPLVTAIEKFLSHFGGVSTAAKAALLELKESNMDVKNVTTQELVDYYNKHSEKPIKKFTDRATAEKRVQAMLDAKTTKAHAPATAPTKAPAAAKPKAKESKSKSLCNVKVNKGEAKQHHSVFQAFEYYKLPVAHHKKVRVELKAHGKAKYEHKGTLYEFSV